MDFLRNARHRLLVVILALFAVVTCASPASAASGVVPDSGQTIDHDDVDAHDGMITQVGDTYYLYGTRYDCGFEWLNRNTNFCGFAVYTSTDKVHWTDRGNLFDPNGWNPWGGIDPGGMSWQKTCVKRNGGGCFNPRMVRRPSDGVWILWFNAPDDYWQIGANAYYVMGCNSPAGPCGEGVGGNGHTFKPAMHNCYGNGDFSIVDDGGPFIVCTMADQTISVEPLDEWWVNGVGGGQSHVGNRTDVESPAVFRSGGRLFMTLSDINCGYCDGTGTGVLYSDAGMLGPWRSMGKISEDSCDGQPRSLSWVDGQPIQWIDQWYPSHKTNQKEADIRLEPLHVQANNTLAPLPPAETCGRAPS